MSVFRTGLMSVTFRDLTPSDIIGLARENGLDRISWSGDVHVLPGDVEGAGRLREAMAAAGLESEGYASYWRADDAPHPELVDTAAALGAPRIRLWAGTKASEEVPAAERTEMAARMAEFADHAARCGIRSYLEFHRNTLTDTAESTMALLQEVASLRRDGASWMRTYWQPRPGVAPETAHAEISLLGPHTDALHVFSWDADAVKLPLEAARGPWLERLDWMAATRSGPVDLLLEFVAGGTVEQFRCDAAELNAWAAQANYPTPRRNHTP